MQVTEGPRYDSPKRLSTLLQHIELDDIQELVLMRNAISNSILGRTAAAGALLLGAAFASQAAMACTLDNWTSSNGAVAAGDPPRSRSERRS